MSDPRKYDNSFFSVIQNAGNIDGFMDAVFGFLYRGTDFYRLMSQDQTKMGFPPGVAEKKTLQHFRRYEKLAREDEARKEKQKQKETAQLPPAESVPIAVREEEIVDNITDSEVAHVPESTPQAAAQSQPSKSQPEAASAAQPKPESVNGNSAAGSVKNSSDKTKGEEEDEDPELTKLQKEYQSMPESYNGADRGTYAWSQSISDCDVRVRIPKYITKGKEVNVKLARKHIKVSAKTESGDMKVLIDDSLLWDVNLEESMWTLVPNEYIHINLEKVQERWWEAVLVNEPKINVRKIDPSRPMTDLDDEAQAKIEEMMFNEHQKRLGKPQSHEMKVHDMLKEAWNKEGSPFKGTPFDPSKVQISPSGGPGGGMG